MCEEVKMFLLKKNYDTGKIKSRPIAIKDRKRFEGSKYTRTELPEKLSTRIFEVIGPRNE